MKTALNIILLRITGSDPKTALLAGLSMAQIGEFSFVLAAAGFASGAFGSDIYRLAIAVTAISLLVSPDLVQPDGACRKSWRVKASGSYKQALAQAYEDELDGVENVVWAARARYRAARFALYQRKMRKSPRSKRIRIRRRCRGNSGTAGEAVESAQDGAEADLSGDKATAAERDDCK
jgi:CPA2 family monovalent cation:H+ antiporter-2